MLRGALAAELRRLPVEVTGLALGMAATALLAGACELPPAVHAASERRRRPRKNVTAEHVEREQSRLAVRPAVNQLGDVEPIEPAPNPSAKPSAKGFAKAQGEGEGAWVLWSPSSWKKLGFMASAPRDAHTRGSRPPGR